MMQVTERSFRIFRKVVRPRKRGGHTTSFDKFHVFSISQNSHPIAALHALEDVSNHIEEMRRIPELSYTRVLSVRYLPSTTIQKKHYNR